MKQYISNRLNDISRSKAELVMLVAHAFVNAAPVAIFIFGVFHLAHRRLVEGGKHHAWTRTKHSFSSCNISIRPPLLKELLNVNDFPGTTIVKPQFIIFLFVASNT